MNTASNSPNFDELKRQVHEALKNYDKPNKQQSPFDELLLYKQAYREVDHVRQATNQVLHAGFERLAGKQQDDADFLRLRFIEKLTMDAVAHRLNISVSSGYNTQSQAITHLTEAILQIELTARQQCQSLLERDLTLPPSTTLFGTEGILKTLLQVLEDDKTPWLLSIEGLGGIGKTALANSLIRQIALTSFHYQTIGWVSAKQQNFVPTSGVYESMEPALNLNTLTQMLLEQLCPNVTIPATQAERRAILVQKLKEAPHLVVIDNLETAEDHQALLPTLKQWANPSRFVITSRYSLRGDGDVYSFQVPQLSEADTFAFLRHEGQASGITGMDQVSDGELSDIYAVVGGNPLALKLVIGQICTLSLPQVIESLKKAQGARIDELYTYIYWQAWHLLDQLGQDVFQATAVANDGTPEQLMSITELTPDLLANALEQLVKLSLVDVGGTLSERRYHIHDLTRTFLISDVAEQWQTIP